MMQSDVEESVRKRRKFILGVLVLLGVDILWVASAELSEYIFHQANFNKPFFTTYFKTSMFSIYLFGFFFVRRWQYQLLHPYSNAKVSQKLLKEVTRLSIPSEAQHNATSPSDNRSGCSSPIPTDGNFTPPTYENMTDDDLSVNSFSDSSQRKVSFSHVREVRSLSKKHTDAQTLARMSEQSVELLRKILTEVNEKMLLVDTAKLAAIFVLLWMFATLMYQEALAQTSAAVTNILSSTSGIFTLILGAIFPSSIVDKFSISKLLAVLASFAGIFLISWTDPSRKHSEFDLGAIFALLGALFYACYLVMVKRKVGKEQLDMPLFFGFVGLFGMIIFWPGFLILHYTNVETFELPANKRVWAFLVVNALIGTVLSELLWLWGCFLTSALMATLSLVLVIPLSLLWDILVNSIKFSWLFILGVVPVILSFVIVTVLTHYGDWDPVKDCLVKWCSWKTSNLEEEKSGLLNDDSNTQQLEA